MENIIKVLKENNFIKTVGGYKRNINNSFVTIDFKFKGEKILAIIIDEYAVDEDECIIFMDETKTYFKPTIEEAFTILNSYL